MQEIHTSKMGEGASVSRRKFMAFATAGATVTLPAVASASGKTGRLPQSPVIDPIRIAIKAYEDGLAAFEAMAGHCDDGTLDAAIEDTYGPAMQRLDNWDAPALTKEGATCALRLALKEEGEFQGSPLSSAMIKAALGWLEGGAA